jgi:hypothetical protein
MRLAAAIATSLENALFNGSIHGTITQVAAGSRPGHGQRKNTPENQESRANDGHSESLSVDDGSLQIKIVTLM